jgi:hypothetical protein
MRAHEFISEEDYGVSISQPVTLRNLHKMKHEKRRDEASERQRLAIMRVMYVDPASEQERLELERLRLGLEKMKAEIVATNAETNAKTKEAISSMAQSGIEAERDSRQKIAKQAKRGLGRRKKCSTAT